MNIWCTDFTSSVLWVLKSGFHQPSQAGGEETVMRKKKTQWEKRALLAITVIPDVLCTHMINPFIDQLLWPNAPLRRCQSRRVPAYGPSEMSSTHTPLLSSARWLFEWLTDSLTQTAGDSVYPPEFNIIKERTLPCSSLETGHLSVFLFLYHFLSRAGVRMNPLSHLPMQCELKKSTSYKHFSFGHFWFSFQILIINQHSHF